VGEGEGGQGRSWLIDVSTGPGIFLGEASCCDFYKRNISMGVLRLKFL